MRVSGLVIFTWRRGRRRCWLRVLPNPDGICRYWNADGSVAQELQLKATQSLSYVKEALERYPDIQVLATDDVLENGADALGRVFLHWLF
jgi:hypothetical protein